jgi:hypothetical protein
VGRLEKRVSALEERVVGWGTGETLLLDQALACLAHEDLLLLSEYLRRGDGEYAEPTEDEAAVLLRLEELFADARRAS